jgi:hypothetical protein
VDESEVRATNMVTLRSPSGHDLPTGAARTESGNPGQFVKPFLVHVGSRDGAPGRRSRRYGADFRAADR